MKGARSDDLAPLSVMALASSCDRMLTSRNNVHNINLWPPVFDSINHQLDMNSFGGRRTMAEGGDRGKGPNKTGTQPKGRIKESPQKPGNEAVKAGVGKGAAQSKHAAKKAQGVATSETRKAGPKKIAARTTS